MAGAVRVGGAGGGATGSVTAGSGSVGVVSVPVVAVVVVVSVGTASVLVVGAVGVSSQGSAPPATVVTAAASSQALGSALAVATANPAAESEPAATAAAAMPSVRPIPRTGTARNDTKSPAAGRGPAGRYGLRVTRVWTMQSSAPSLADPATASSVPACARDTEYGKSTCQRPPAPVAGRSRTSRPSAPRTRTHERMLEEVALAARCTHPAARDGEAAQRQAPVRRPPDPSARNRRSRPPEVDDEPVGAAHHEVGHVLEAPRLRLELHEDVVRPLADEGADARAP